MNVSQYARQKRLDPALLRKVGIRDGRWNGNTAVVIPYFSPSMEIVCIRYRVDTGFRWRKGDVPTLYGLWHRYCEGQPVLICEGETDTLTCWQHGLYALGVPGAATWRTDWWALLPPVWPYLLQDTDIAGSRLAHNIAASIGRVFIVDLRPYKDVNEAYLDLDSAFLPWLTERLAQASSRVKKAESMIHIPRGHNYEQGDILTLAQEYTELRAVNGQWRGRCPLGTHADRNPSFYVHPERGWYCFGCGEGGGYGSLKQKLEARRHAET